MKRVSLLLVCALCAVLILPRAMQAQGVHQGWGLSHFSGLIANSHFFLVAENSVTDVVINVSQGKFSQPPGAPVSQTQVNIDLTQWDTATSTLLKDTNGTVVVPDSAFQESAKYDSATLTNVEFYVWDSVKGDMAHVVIPSLQWTAIGPVNKGWGNWRGKGPGYVDGGTWNGDNRPAFAIGTIEYDDDTISLDTGNPPVAPSSANTGSSKSGFVYNVLKP